MSTIENLHQKRGLSLPRLDTRKIREKILKRADNIINPPFNTKDGKPLETTVYKANEIPQPLAKVLTALPERILAVEYILNNPDLTEREKRDTIEQINAFK
ncbi:MAG: hypothetical protein PVJ52_03450 [Candidatus Woesebacteria bacterium]